MAHLFDLPNQKTKKSFAGSMSTIGASHQINSSTPAPITVSLIIPVLNEAKYISGILSHVQRISGWHQCVVTDGGSSDQTCANVRAHPLGPHLIEVTGGRAAQLNAAINYLTSDVVVILSVDCRLSPHALDAIRKAVSQGAVGGCLRLHNASNNVLFRWLNSWARLRTVWTAGPYVDQAPFFVRQIAQQYAFRPLDSYDTADLGRRMSKGRQVRIVGAKVVASCRHWHRFGLWVGTWMHQRKRMQHWYRHL